MNHSMISTPDRDPFGEANFELFDFNENKHYPRQDSTRDAWTELNGVQKIFGPVHASGQLI